MTRHLYLRLALRNICNHRRFYLPFLLTAAMTTASFYMILAIVLNPGRPGGITTKEILSFGAVVIALFSLIFLFYTNSFLIRRRKKELGLYNILGMEKRHIAKVLLWETVFSVILAVGGGLLLGLLLFRLTFLLLLNTIHLSISFTSALVPRALGFTALLFLAIFALLLLANLRQVAFTKPIELLHGGTMGEKEPRVNWLLVVLGVLLLAAGYAISLSVKEIGYAVVLFFVAVLLVIFGTYCLFTGISIAVLKFLKGRKRFYYKPNHFISVSGMLYRMKQNAVGLANICILSTMVLVTLSTTISLYCGINDILRAQYPHDVTIALQSSTEDGLARAKEIITATEQDTGVNVKQMVHYYSFTQQWLMEGDQFLSYYSDEAASSSSMTSARLCVVTAEDWETLSGQHYNLTGNEVALGKVSGSLGNSFSIMDESYSVKFQITDFPSDAPLGNYNDLNLYYIVVSDFSTLQHIYAQEAAQEAQYWDDADPSGFPNLYFRLDLEGTDAEKEFFSSTLKSRILGSSSLLSTQPYSVTFSSRLENVDSTYAFYGSFLFIGVFFGALFLMATVLIIYYKQVMEGYDDRSRFEILQKVGMDRRLISSSVRSQVLTMFLLPLGVAAMHLTFAFPMLSKVLQGFCLTDTGIFLRCTVLTFAAFAAVYLVVYGITSRVYYKTISGATE